MNFTGVWRLIMLLILLLVVTAACGDRGSQEDISPNSSRLDADAAWQDVISGGARLPVADYRSFLIQLEASKRRFRERGLVFWESFPEDPRRFYWLILTTYLDPSYAQDMDAWATASLELGVIVSARDEEAVAAWRELYPSLRNEFMVSRGVGERGHRQLLSAEAYSALKEAQRTYQASEVRPDKDVAFARTLSFLSSYSTPLSNQGLEPSSYAFDRDRVLAPMLGWMDTGFDESSAAELAGIIEQRNLPWYEFYARITRDGLYRSTIIRENLSAHARLREYFRARDLSTWEDWRSLDATDESVLAAVYASSYNYPVRNVSVEDDPVATAIAFFQIHTAIPRFRALGSAHFDRMPFDAQVHWIAETTSRPPFGVAGVFAYMSDPPESFRSVDEDLVALSWLKQSDQMVRERIDQLLADESVNDELRNRLRLMRVRVGTIAASYQWMFENDRSLIDEQLALISQLALVHGQSGDAASLMRSFIRSGESSMDWYGLSKTDLAAYLTPFLDSDAPEMRDLAESFLSRVQLAPGITVSIQAPTLDGAVTVSVADFEGKIVLVDNWDTNCAPCIAAFPNLQGILNDYSDFGFEIMSIAYDGESQKARIQQIKSRLGLTWETLNGEGLWPAVSARYGLSGFPQYILLDRKGRYVAGNAEIAGTENLRSLLDELIAQDDTEYYK